MAGVNMTVTIDDREVQDLLKRLARRMADMTPAFAEIGEIVMESVQRNFEEKRAPDGTKWAPLAASTLKRKRHPGEILIGENVLFPSIHPEAYKDSVAVGTNIIYGAIHQLGGFAGRGHATKIPARPYLGVRDEDWPEIRAAIEDWIMGAQ